MPSATPRYHERTVVDYRLMILTTSYLQGRDHLPRRYSLRLHNLVNSPGLSQHFATNPHLREIMKNTLYAIHRDGGRLYLPRWDADGEIIATKLPTAAVTIDRDGKTFPEGSVGIHKPRSWGLLDGWKLAIGKTTAERKLRKKRA